MKLISYLSEKWKGIETPFLVYEKKELFFKDISNQKLFDISSIPSGSVVALIGDFNPYSIMVFLTLIENNNIIVPLTKDTKDQHNYFFEQSLVDFVIDENKVTKIRHNKKNNILELFRTKKKPGLVLFSTGTTGLPKAILHDFNLFLKRFETPRPTYRTLNFLLFDHIGGINTLFHTLFNKGMVIAPKDRNVNTVLDTCFEYNVEVLPTTPTFLRMLLISGLIPKKISSSLKVITYGTEMMDQTTLQELCDLLPTVDFRQTFGMSELGIVRVKSESRNSLFMKIGGEGVETKTIDNVLYIRSKSKMLGYLNAESPFDKEGWYNTKDIVEKKGEYYKVIGRIGDVINVGGLKFMASDIEKVALSNPKISLVKVITKKNPITGQHIEIIIETRDPKFKDVEFFKRFFREKLPNHMTPKRITIDKIKISHRLKKG